MRKILAICGLLFGLLIVRPAFAEEIASANVSGLYSIRHKQFTGDLNIRQEKGGLFGKDYLKGKLGVIPEIGVDKEKEFIAGIDVDLIKVLDAKELWDFLKIIKVELGIWGGIILKDGGIKKWQGDGGITFIKISIPLGGTGGE